jgi:iron complex outermembrane receptor protein
VFYTHFKTKEQQRGLVLWCQGGLTPTSTTVTNGFDTAATFTGVHAVQRNNYNSRTPSTLALGWNGKYRFSDGIRLTLDASYSRASP